jgi:hypothetical protein
MEITSLYSTTLKQGSNVIFIPQDNIGSKIQLIYKDEAKFSIIDNGKTKLFDNSKVFITEMKTTDTTVTSAELTIRLFVSTTSETYNEVRIQVYPNATISISDDNSTQTITNGINAVSLEPSYYIDLTLSTTKSSISSGGEKTFLFTVPILQISKVKQANHGLVGIKLVKPTERHIINSCSVSSSGTLTTKFKVYVDETGMLQAIDSIADSDIFPVQLLNSNLQVNVLDLDELYLLFDVYKDSLDDVVYIKSFNIEWGSNN